MKEKYIDPDRPLKYVYKSENRSILDRYVLNHWWPIAIRAVPAKASANLVSIVGSLCCWACFLVLAGVFTGPLESAGRAKPWLFGIAALLLFAYQTLDALDGVQARRTGASGPLGEFIDHWFDSINAFLVPFGAALAFPVVPPALVAVALFLVASASWLSARAMRDTGVMKFGPVSGEEVLSLSYLLLLAIWATGYGFWASPGALGIPPILLVYYLVPLLLAAASVSAALSVKGPAGFACFAAATASALPALVWTLIALPGQGRPALVLGGLLIGFLGARLDGDVLRDRLVGLEYRAWQPDILVLGAVLLASVLVPGLPSWAPLAAAGGALAWLAITLCVQFVRTVARVREVTGVRLFRPAPLAAPQAVPKA